MIHLTQVIYLHSGQEDAFNEFESIALPAMSKYGGKLLLRIRPGQDTIIDQTIETPYEIHIISFEDEAGIKSFLQDPERLRFLYLKEQSVRLSYLYKDTEVRS